MGGREIEKEKEKRHERQMHVRDRDRNTENVTYAAQSRQLLESRTAKTLAEKLQARRRLRCWRGKAESIMRRVGEERRHMKTQERWVAGLPFCF